jgi:glucosylceramidase
MLINKKIQTFLLAFLLAGCAQSSDGSEPNPNPNPTTNEVDFWLTKANGSVKLEKQTVVLGFNTNTNIYQNIDVSDSQAFQTIDGFGFTLTGGSAHAINQLTPSKKQELIQELFGATANAISINYLRISIGASDLSLANFSLAPDAELIQLLKDILIINPNIKIMATPWSPPVWMKDNNNTIGGSLQPQYYGVYAQYFVKYIQKMQAEGIHIDAITPQNEPLHPGNNPSMLMTALQQAEFIKSHLGPGFQTAGITTKIVAYDHNCDQPQYPITVLSDAAANPYVDGSAFHLYAGDISALNTVHAAFPAKNLYFTEQYTASTGSFDGDLKWHIKNVVIGSMRNWSKTALEWNLANDASFGPHTDGGCTTCKGAITVTGSFSFERNVGYYIIAHASKFIPVGSVRINSTQTATLSTVAFKTPSNKKVLIALNENPTPQIFNIKYNGRWVAVSLEAGSVGTFVW